MKACVFCNDEDHESCGVLGGGVCCCEIVEYFKKQNLDIEDDIFDDVPSNPVIESPDDVFSENTAQEKSSLSSTTQKEDNKSHVGFDVLIAEFERVWSYLGKQTAEEFVLALISLAIAKSETRFPFRVIRHPLLFWDAGWYKTSMLDALNCCCIGPYKAGEITSITEAALRGTTINISTNKQVFVPPEPLLNAIVIFPDMIPVFTSKISEGISGQLLTLLDKGKIRVGLAKFAEPSATKAIKDWIVSHGMEKKMFIEDGRLGYEVDMIAVGAIHKVINELTDPAFRDRFIIVYPERENWQKGLIQRTVICDIKYTFTRHASVILQELTEIKKECVDAGQKDYELWRVIRDRINTYMEK